MPQSKAVKPSYMAYTPERLEYQDGYESYVHIWVERLSPQDIKYLLTFKNLDRIQVNADDVNLQTKSIKLLNDKFFSQRKNVALRFYHFKQDPAVFSGLNQVERFCLEEMYPSKSYKNPIKSLDFLSKLIQLKELELTFYKIDHIEALQNLPRLEKLVLDSVKPSKVSLDILQRLPLKELILSNTKNLASLPPIDSLQDLNISTICLDKNTIAPLAKLKNLESLFYYYWGKNADLTTLPSLKKLKKLFLKHMLLENFDFLSDMKNLKELTLFHLPNLKKLPSLKNLKKLKKITFTDDFKNLDDISSLTEAKSLEYLNMEPLKGHTPQDYKRILKRLPKLKYVNILFFKKKDQKEFANILKELHLKSKFD